MKTIVILGSSRKDGETEHLAEELIHQSNWDLIDLNDYDFSYYDYEHKNQNDDFIPLMKKIIENYEILIFMTPVYWYSMSGILKVFFDRITDLLTIKKELGRKLRGKKMAAISCSNGSNLGEYFWLPFSNTADYLGMDYLGNVHAINGEENTSRLTDFVHKIKVFER